LYTIASRKATTFGSMKDEENNTIIDPEKNAASQAAMVMLIQYGTAGRMNLSEGFM